MVEHTSHFQQPNLNYTIPAHLDGLTAGPAVPPPATSAAASVVVPPPTVHALPPVRQGFTRSPTDDQTIVCPNCGDELGTGETDEQRQVWFVRGCGHVSHFPYPFREGELLSLQHVVNRLIDDMDGGDRSTAVNAPNIEGSGNVNVPSNGKANRSRLVRSVIEASVLEPPSNRFIYKRFIQWMFEP